MKFERVNFGEIIRSLVSKRGYNDAQFAKLIGLHRQNIKKTVYEKSSLDVYLLCKISEVLDCNLFDYLGCNTNDDSKELKATISIEMGMEKQDKTFRFLFGKNDVKIS